MIQQAIRKNITTSKLNYLKQHSIYSIIISQIQQLCRYHNIDGTHGLSHAIKIAQLASNAMQSQNFDNQLRQDVICSAFLHDVDDRKYFNSRNYQNAYTILQKTNINQQRTKRIIKMIDLVSFAKNGNNIEKDIPYIYYITRYIDRTQAIGVQGLHRSLEYNKQRIQKVPIYQQQTPRPKNHFQLDLFSKGRDIQYMKKGVSKSVVDHVFDKLLHLRLPEQIKNDYMINLYNEKKKEMQQFILKHSLTNYQNYEKDLQQEYQKNRHIWYNQI